MPSDTHGNDAQGEPGDETDADATQATREGDLTADHGPDDAGDPAATEPSPEVRAGGLDQTTAPITVAEGDTDEFPVVPTGAGAPPAEQDYDVAPPDRAHRNRRRALIATLVVAIVALVGLGAAILATEDEEGDNTPASTTSTSTSTVPPTTEGQTPAPSESGTTATTAPSTTTTAPTTTTTQPTTTTAPTTTTTEPTTTTAPTTTTTTAQ